jgi:hypothetical protein
MITFDPTPIVNAQQQSNQILAKIQQTLAAQVAPLHGYATASLPTTLPAFSLAIATNGRANAGQGAGAGTGTLVWYNGSAWIAVWSGVTVTA